MSSIVQDNGRSGGAVAWVTGASSGIGARTAELLAERGWRVVISARRVDRLDAVARNHANMATYPLDMTDADAVAAAPREIELRHGPIALCVLNAGDYSPMPCTALDVPRMQALMDVNYFGTVRAVHAVLPGMHERGDGHIVINASVAGYRGLPNAAGYGPTKAALNNFAETLNLELGRTLKVQVVNPGFVKTPLTDQNSFAMPALMTVDDAARRLLRGLDTGGFEITFPRRFTWVMKALRCLPHRLYFPFVRYATRARD